MTTLRKLFVVGASLGVLALGVWGWRAAAADPFGARQIDTENLPFDSLTYAYHTFLWYNPAAELHLDWTRMSNYTHVKQIFAWEDIQPGPDLWVWERADEVVQTADEKNVQIVARLSDAPDWTHPTAGVKDEDWHDAPPDNLADFGNFCGEIASRYATRIAAYQVWNEPNLDREWGNLTPNAVDYVALLASCSEAIREADPQAIIISAGLSPTGTWSEKVTPDDIYLQQMYDAGFTQYVDVVGVHAPGFSNVAYGPDDAERDGNGRWATFRRVEDLRKIMVRNGDGAKQMAILEMGWTVAPPELEAYAWFAVEDEFAQADRLLEAHAYIAEHWRPWVGLVTTIYLADPAWDEGDEEMYFAITLPNNWARPALSNLGNMPKYCLGGVVPPRHPGSPEALGLDDDLPCN